MKNYILLLFLAFISCTPSKGESVSNIILENNTINTAYLNQIKAPEKALLSWYLYAYGNECNESSSKIKCQLLKELHIEDECNPKHLSNLLQWFSTDMLAVYKLNKCPNISAKSAIQNTFEKIVLFKNGDTLSIQFSIKGLNTLQEKSWNIHQKDSYIIKNNTLIKIESNE